MLKKVYFAGKVKKDGFRQKLMGKGIMHKGCGTVVTINGGQLIYGGCDGIDTLAKDDYQRNENHLLTVVDHGDLQKWTDTWDRDQLEYRGYNNHRYTALSPEDVVKRCFKQIAECDAVYAYIDANDCWGTIAELGYANALNKPIYLVFDTKFLSSTIDKYQQLPYVEIEWSGHCPLNWLDKKNTCLIGESYVPIPTSLELSWNINIFDKDLLVNYIPFVELIKAHSSSEEFNLFNILFKRLKKEWLNVNVILDNVIAFHNHKSFLPDYNDLFLPKKQDQSDKKTMYLSFIEFVHKLFVQGYIFEFKYEDDSQIIIHRQHDEVDQDVPYDSFYQDFWFIRHLPSVKQVLKSEDPFPQELLYFEPRWSVRNILAQCLMTVSETNELEDLKQLGKLVAQEYRKRYGKDPFTQNADSKGVKTPVNLYSSKDAEWIQEIVKKNAKPDYKAMWIMELTSHLSNLLELLDFDLDKTIPNIWHQCQWLLDLNELSTKCLKDYYFDCYSHPDHDNPDDNWNALLLRVNEYIENHSSV